MTELISNYYLEHKSIFEENFKQAIENFNPESIHKMRTSTKRLRALFHLIGYLSEDKFKTKKYIAELRTLFKQVGIIREIQIEQLLVTENELSLKKAYPEYKDYLKKREKSEVKKFIGHLKSFSSLDVIFADRKIFKAINAIDDKKVSNKARKFLTKNLTRLVEINAQPVSNSRVHQNRTVIKQIYYLYDLLTQLIGQKKILDISAARLKEVEQLIGHWHDLHNSILFLTQFLKTKKGNKLTNYSEIKKQILIRKKQAAKRNR